MPQVPQVLPSVQPQGQSGGFFNIQDPTMAFGYGVGKAQEGFGREIERGGDMLQKHATFLQDRANAAQATNLFVEWDKEAAQLQMWHKTQEGTNAVSTLPELYRKQDELREKYISRTPNVEVRRLFDLDSKRRLGFMIQDAGSYAATQNKRSNIATSQARQSMAIQGAGNSRDDEEFNFNVESALKGLDAEAVERGWTPEQKEVQKHAVVSKTWQSRLDTIAMTDPFRAKDLYEKNKDKILDPVTRMHIEQTLLRQYNNVGTRYDADSIVNGTGFRAFPNIGGATHRDAIGAIESSGRYDAQGPIVTKGSFAGQRGIGKYQVIEGNVGPWTEEVLGKAMTPEQFRKDPDAQDAVFDAKFGQLLKKYGNPQDAASAWHSGRPLAEAIKAGATDQYTRTEDYVKRFTAALGTGAAQPLTTESGPEWLKGALERAKAIAQARALDNPAYEDTLVSRVKSEYSNVKTVKNAVDIENFMNVQQALIEQKDGKPVVTTVSQLLDNPALNQAYNALNPAKQKQVISQIERNAKADVPLTSERWNRFQELKGIAVNDPKAFMNVEVGAEDLPRTLQGQLFTQQRGMQKNLQDTTRLTRAINTVTPMLNDAGIVRSRTDAGKAATYNQFVGAYQTELENWEKQNQKFPNEKEQMQLAAKLLRETNPDRWFFQSAQRGFEIPETNRIEIVEAFTKRYGRPPSPAEAYTVFQRQQARETNATQ